MGAPIYIQGKGAVTPLGGTWPVSARELASGHCAIRPVERFDVTGFPCTVAAAVPTPSLAHEDRRVALALEAATEAWQQYSALGPRAVRDDRIGVYIGAESGRASLPTILALAAHAGGGAVFDHVRFGREARRLAGAVDASSVSPAAVASRVAELVGARGPTRTVSLACASSGAAIVEGVRQLRLGRVDVAVCGGVGADVDPLMMVGFGLLGILSPSGISRPFDRRRDGFVIGEGAAMLVLTRERGAAAGAILGVGRSLDAHHLTAPHPEGRGAAAAIQQAMRDAGLQGVDYVQAHGTSTLLNDPVELKALRHVFGPRSSTTPIASVKGALGHWIAGAGALGVLCVLEAVENGRLLPTAGLESPDPDCVAAHVLGVARQAAVQTALSNAFAFGGANSSIVVGRVQTA